MSDETVTFKEEWGPGYHTWKLFPHAQRVSVTIDVQDGDSIADLMHRAADAIANAPARSKTRRRPKRP